MLWSSFTCTDCNGPIDAYNRCACNARMEESPNRVLARDLEAKRLRAEAERLERQNAEVRAKKARLP